MDLGLENRVALVAGGSSGLGLGAALALAAEGAHVAIGARDPDRLAAAEGRLRQVARGRVHTTSVDITDRAAAHSWVEEVAADFGALHVVLISGGGPPIGEASSFEPDDYETALDTVLLPAVGLTLAALPHLRAAGWGRVLFVTSEAAVVPHPKLALSGVARAGIIRFAQSLAAEVGRDGITINVLAPGPTRTELLERGAARLGGDLEAQLAAMGSHTAVGRLGSVEEFAAVAAFLASERASYITGNVHLLDGGASISGREHTYLAAGRKDTFR